MNTAVLDFALPDGDVLVDGDSLECSLPGVCNTLSGEYYRQCHDKFDRWDLIVTADGEVFPCATLTDCSAAVASAMAWCDTH